jgi:regulator of sigma E protease
MNLLPVPVLDGGQLMFIAAEAVRRKPLSMRAREYAIYAGLVMLLLIMAVAFTNDIVKFIL